MLYKIVYVDFQIFRGRLAIAQNSMVGARKQGNKFVLYLELRLTFGKAFVTIFIIGNSSPPPKDSRNSHAVTGTLCAYIAPSISLAISTYIESPSIELIIQAFQA